MTFYFMTVFDRYIKSYGSARKEVQTAISEEVYNAIVEKVKEKPSAPNGYDFKLRADTLEWELVELPPEPEDEPSVEDKAEAYDILMGGAP